MIMSGVLEVSIYALMRSDTFLKLFDSGFMLDGQYRAKMGKSSFRCALFPITRNKNIGHIFSPLSNYYVKGKVNNVELAKTLLLLNLCSSSGPALYET